MSFFYQNTTFIVHSPLNKKYVSELLFINPQPCCHGREKYVNELSFIKQQPR